MALRPIRDKVVVKPSAEEEKSAGGIFLPDTAKKKPQEGRVVAVGTRAGRDQASVVEEEDAARRRTAAAACISNCRGKGDAG